MARAHDSLFLSPNDPRRNRIPTVDGTKFVLHGELHTWPGPFKAITTPVLSQGAAGPDIILGQYPMMTADAALKALDSSVKAYAQGQGLWPSLRFDERVAAMRKFQAGLKAKRDEIANLIAWEICKPQKDSEKEVDRTIQYIEDTITTLEQVERRDCAFEHNEGVTAQIRRSPYGVVLCAGPFNYPLNETYTTLIPALLMGNTVLLKLPRIGVLCHWPTFELFAACFPPGVVNVVLGSGRETMTPLMKSGKVDVLAFIGTSTAADALQRAHPKPHRLRCCLACEAKNPAIIFPDADLNVAVRECVSGSLSFNGQRCTAIKIIFVHENVKDEFLAMLSAAVDSLVVGLPWDANVAITPLPEEGKPAYLQALLADAVAHGGAVINPKGGVVDRTFVTPAVVFPVTAAMKLYHEEQFGPIVPVRSWSDQAELLEYVTSSQYGQQASIFSKDPAQVGKLIDVLSTQVSRINLNSQCQRGPDTFPFTGRKDSAFGTLSVYDALRVFSMRALVATKDSKDNTALMTAIAEGGHSNFLRSHV